MMPETLPAWAPYALAVAVVGVFALVTKAREADDLTPDVETGLSRGATLHLIVFVATFVGGVVLGLRFPPERVTALLWRTVTDAVPFLATWGVGI